MSNAILAQSEIVFESMDVLPRHIDAAGLEIARHARGDQSLEKALAKAQAGLARGEYWTGRQGVFHIESATTRGKVYSVDVLGYCSCPAQGRCWHQVARELVVLAGSLASVEAWDYIRAQGGSAIWRTKTGFLGCFDGTVVVHAQQPCDARAALLDYQVGLIEHGLLDVCAPTHNLAVRIVNGMHSAYFAALVDAGVPTTRDVVAERRARLARAAVLVIVDQAA